MTTRNEKLKENLTRIALEAFKAEDSARLNEALDRGADPKALMASAVDRKNVALIKTLLRKGADFSGIPFEKIKVNAEVAEIAIDRKVFVQEFLLLALDQKDPKAFRMAIDNGGDVRISAGQPPLPLLHIAVSKQKFHSEIATLILLQGTDIDLKDADGKTALAKAAASTDWGWSNQSDNSSLPAHVEFLLKQGADPTLCDNAGKSVFDVCEENTSDSFRSHKKNFIGRLLEGVTRVGAAKDFLPEDAMSLDKALPAAKSISFKPHTPK